MQSPKTTRALPLINAALAIGVAAALLFSSPARGEERQKLYVLFVTDAPHLKRIYGSTGYSRIGRGLSDKLEQLGNEKYGFLEWSSATKEVAQGAPDRVLAIYLKSQDVKLGKFQSFEVLLDSSLPKEPKEPPQEKQLYRPMQTLPKNVTKLNEEIEKNITDLFENQPFHEKLRKFLGRIPISHQAEVLKNRPLLAVPLCRSQIAAGKNSKMMLSVYSLKSNGDEVPATLYLDVLDYPIRPKDFPEAYRMIQCNITMLTFDNREQSASYQTIREVFDQRVPDTLDVFMTDYVRADINIVGSMAATPRQGDHRRERACQP